jgi:hypothetical protein
VVIGAVGRGIVGFADPFPAFRAMVQNLTKNKAFIVLERE